MKRLLHTLLLLLVLCLPCRAADTQDTRYPVIGFRPVAEPVEP